MKTVILDANTLGDDLDLSIFSQFGEYTVYPATLPEEAAERIGDADIVVVNKVKLNKATLGKADRLKLICITATGYDNIDIEYMRSRGIGVCNVCGYSTDSVAQVTVAMALSLFTHLAEYRRYVADGDYSRSGAANRVTPVFRELSGKTWGIVGYGNIGRKVGAAAAALGCRVICTKQRPDESCPIVDIDTLCRESDIISVHVPLSAETADLINRERIGMMKRDAVFINVARGAVCDEEALCRAVLDKKIGAVGIDVYTGEPIAKDSPYQSVMHLPNVCLTPHMAWGALEARKRCIDDIVLSIKAFLKGERRSRLV